MGTNFALMPKRGYMAWLYLFLVASSTGSAFTAASNHPSLANAALRTLNGGASGVVTTRHNNGTQFRLDDHSTPTISASFYESDHQDVQRVMKEAMESKKGPLKVLFLSADTGGGHRASAEALAKQFQIHFPGSTYDLLDIWTEDGIYPYKTLVNSYKHLSAHPRQWRILYHLSNTRPHEFLSDLHSTLTCERKIRRRIASYDPDVIVSVHPTMNRAPIISTKKISKALGKHIPFFTVVTDFGSGHCMWFQRNVEKVYVASERIRKLARRRGGTPERNIVMTGLPIRHDFAVEAEQLGDRTSVPGKAYQQLVRTQLGIDPNKKMVLVMGGGEGVGSLSDIVNQLYAKFSLQGIAVTICVVCGRNEKLKSELEVRDWQKVVEDSQKPKRRQRLRRLFRRKSNRSRQIQASLDKVTESESPNGSYGQGQVEVVGLGFISHMAAFMVAADVLVTKAGPGTIAEAAAVGLPIMLTSFLPGQEAGNVDIVLEGGFGDYCEDPEGIAEEVACWLKDGKLLDVMSVGAQKVGNPYAASEIVQDIGDITHAWMTLNAQGKLV